MSRIEQSSPATPIQPQIQVGETRARTTARAERSSFGKVLLSGVEIGATVIAGPIAGAAVRTISGPLGASGGGSSEQSTIDEMRALQEQSQSFNMQYLALQEEVQQENRRFSTVSNVLKAKHETAKSAIGNIRS